MILVVLVGLPTPSSAASETLYVRPAQANVRTSSTIADDNILTKLPQGTPVMVSEPEGDWHPVQLEDGRSGWMHRSVLQADKPSSSPQTPSPRLPFVRIGIVQDSETMSAESAIFEKELQDLLGSDYTVRFPASMRVQANWSVDRVRNGLEALLANPNVDIVLALGLLSSQEAARRQTLPKPVFAPFVMNTKVQKTPLQNGKSGVRNLSYVTLPPSLQSNLKAFLNITRFTTFGFLIPQGLVEGLPGLAEFVRQEIAALDLKVVLVPVGTTADSALSALSDDIQAVLVVPQPQLSKDEFAKLVQGLIDRRLPSFAAQRSDTERGLMASLANDTNLTRLARRVALNVQRALEGEDPGTFTVTFAPGERLTLNMATVRAIGLSPPWGYLTQADLLNEEATEVPRQLSLSQAVAAAVNANLDLQAVARFVAAGAENIQEARSFLLPQIEAAADGRVIDEDRAEAAGGSFPERQLTGSINLFQVIYDEPTWANLSIQRDLQVGREEERNITVLDVVFEASVSYLDVLEAKTAEGIQRQNLDLTRTNLELARVRRQIGVARAAEVVRWENQLANNRRTVINAFAQRQQAEIVLNRVLHRPLEETFRTEEPALDDPVLITNFAKVFPYVDNPRYFQLFREFMVQEGIQAAPELRLADAQIQAQERTLRSEQRSFWSPTVSLRANLAGVERDGTGDTSPSLALPGGRSLKFPQDNAWNWEVGATASLPLFTSGKRVARRNRAREELAQLQIEREATTERIATRIRTALYEAGASYASINLAREAAAAARRNYELILDAYRQGTVSILDLLDAQTASLNANLDAANSVYVYLSNLMSVQRAVGQFDFFLSGSGRQAWFEKLDAFFRQQGVTVGP
jgi:outer membrane protein TolC